jgi:hypothetical protein
MTEINSEGMKGTEVELALKEECLEGLKRRLA